MNIRRGILRLWIVASLAWIALSGWWFWNSCVPDQDGWLWCSIGEGDWIVELQYFGWRDVLRIAMWFLGPPILGFTLGGAALWIGKGFSPAGPSN
jgi:hypothetical protein